MKLKFTKNNADEAKEYIGKKVICLYQDSIDSPMRIGILENVNPLISTPFEVNTNLFKILNYFDTIMYDSSLDDTIKGFNQLVHKGHCDHKLNMVEYEINYCPLCGEKLN